MKKNSDFKNINYVSYEMISMIVTLLSCVFISYSPIRIIKNCGSAAVIGILFLCFVAYIIYFFIIKTTFLNEYDMFSMIKKVYPPIIQKIISIAIYLFLLAYIYLLISNLVYNLKASIYTKSTLFSIAIFFIIALYMLAKRGFNVNFRIVGYISFMIIIYIIFLFIMSIKKIDINNLYPLLGNGPKDLFFNNLHNLGIFVPLFLFTFFGGNVARSKKRSIIKNYNIIMIIFTLCYTLLIFTFITTIPIDFITARYTLLLDLSSFISLEPTSIKLLPIMVYIFSLIIFISTAFCLLCGLYNLERLNVVKDYSKFVLPSVILIIILFLLPAPAIIYNYLIGIFYIVSIIITIAFPIFTIVLYYIKTKGGKKKFKANNKKEKYIEEVD